jgi:hypothetical protein
MDQGPLVIDQIEAGEVFLREFNKYRPVQSAFWLKDAEYGRWYLYVASEKITDANFDAAYHEVGLVADAMQDPRFSALEVKVLAATKPLAKAMAELQCRYPGRTPRELRGRTIGGVTVDQVYLYPRPVAVAG